jgi:DNA-binding XRE family transcriptional regulator
LRLTISDSSGYKYAMSDIHPLRAYRQTQTPKLSQEALADKLGVARLTVVRWENGQRKIEGDRILKVAKVTGIPARELRPDLVEQAERLFGGAQ